MRVALEHASRGNELKWSIPEKEMLGLMFSLSVFRTYTAMRHFTIRTDSEALTYLKKTKVSLKSRIGLWALKLNEFDCIIIHIAGKKNQVADALSRNPCDRILNTEQIIEIPSYMIVCDESQDEFVIDGDKLRYLQGLDDWCLEMYKMSAQDEDNKITIQNGLVSLKDGTAEAVAQFLLDKVVCLYGAFRILLSDNGRCYQSKVFREISKQLGAKQQFTNPYTPNCNGLTERIRRLL